MRLPPGESAVEARNDPPARTPSGKTIKKTREQRPDRSPKHRVLSFRAPNPESHE